MIFNEKIRVEWNACLIAFCSNDFFLGELGVFKTMVTHQLNYLLVFESVNPINITVTL